MAAASRARAPSATPRRSRRSSPPLPGQRGLLQRRRRPPPLDDVGRLVRACWYDGSSALSVSLGSPRKVSSAVGFHLSSSGRPPDSSESPTVRRGPHDPSPAASRSSTSPQPAGRQPHAEALAVPDRRRVPYDGPVLALHDRVAALQRGGGGQGDQPRAGVRQRRPPPGPASRTGSAAPGPAAPAPARPDARSRAPGRRARAGSASPPATAISRSSRRRRTGAPGRGAADQRRAARRRPARSSSPRPSGWSPHVGDQVEQRACPARGRSR